MFPNADATAVANTMGLQARRNFLPSDISVQFATPPLLPPIQNSQPNYQVCLYNQTAGLLGKLYADLFPVAQNPDLEETYISDLTILFNNTSAIMEDLGNLKMAILTINQLCQAPTRIPAGFPTPNTDAISNAGLNPTGNTAINLINRIWEDMYYGNYEAAQTDYGRLRNVLRPVLGL